MKIPDISKGWIRFCHLTCHYKSVARKGLLFLGTDLSGTAVAHATDEEVQAYLREAASPEFDARFRLEVGGTTAMVLFDLPEDVARKMLSLSIPKPLPPKNVGVKLLGGADGFVPPEFMRGICFADGTCLLLNTPTQADVEKFRLSFPPVVNEFKNRIDPAAKYQAPLKPVGHIVMPKSTDVLDLDW